MLIWKRKKIESEKKEIQDVVRSREVRKCTEKKRISPNNSKKAAPKVIVDDVDIEQQNQNEHIGTETENVSALKFLLAKWKI